MNHVVKTWVAVTLVASATGCATVERSTALPIEQPAMASQTYTGEKLVVTIATFENKSAYQRGIFSDGVDRLGNQAQTILVAQLNQTQRFAVLDRENLGASEQEATIKNRPLQLKGADFLVTGHVTEFGRKEVGDRQLFGILGRGKEQIAYAKVTLNLVNASTSEVAHSAQGAAEYGLSEREVMGFGSTASYDSTLNGKVLNMAIQQAVVALATAIDAKKAGN